MKSREAVQREYCKTKALPLTTLSSSNPTELTLMLSVITRLFQDGASKKDDMVAGWVCLVIALFILIMCLVGLVALLRTVLLGASTRILYKATDINDLLAMVIGMGVTVLVQSSSITTSTLVPLAGVGIIPLEKLYPLQLGADIGTTFTAVLASLVSSKVESLQVALCHLFFNLTGIVLWYCKFPV